MKFAATKKNSCLEDAQRFLQAAESLNPDSVSVRLAAGLLNQTTGLYEKALEDYRRVQELEPHNIDALLRLASVYDNLDMPDKAIAAYRKAIELDPAYYEPYEELGAFYYNRGKYPEAAKQFQKSIDRAPGMFLAYSDLGVAMMHRGQYAEAEQALLASLKLQETARAQNNLGAIRVYQKRDTEAVTYYERAVALDSHDYLYLLNLGDCYRRLDRHADAVAAYRKALVIAKAELQENPRSGLTRAYLAYFAARLGDRSRAEDEIRQAMELSPGDNMVVRKAVLTYEALGQRERAILALREATSDVLQELDRHPDLADLRLDPRFQQLITKALTGGK